MPTELQLGGGASGAPGQLTAISVTIASGAALSELFSTQGRAIMAIVMPASWTAAAVGLYGGLSNNPAAMLPIYNTAAVPEGTVDAAVQGTIILFPTDAAFLPFLRLASVTAGTFTGVNQGAERTIILILKQYLT